MTQARHSVTIPATLEAKAGGHLWPQIWNRPGKYKTTVKIFQGLTEGAGATAQWCPLFFPSSLLRTRIRRLSNHLQLKRQGNQEPFIKCVLAIFILSNTLLPPSLRPCDLVWDRFLKRNTGVKGYKMTVSDTPLMHLAKWLFKYLGWIYVSTRAGSVCASVSSQKNWVLFVFVFSCNYQPLAGKRIIPSQ